MSGSPKQGMRTAALTHMQTNLRSDREMVSRALIDLVADVAWAERQQVGAATLQRERDEAMSLLPKVQGGDHEAALRAIELVKLAKDRRPEASPPP
jgi:hypothetical protein